MSATIITTLLILSAVLAVNGLYWRRKYRALLWEVADPDDWPARDQRRLYGRNSR